ncbi:MAG: thiolase family protein [Bacteroidetes bacterium]|nr:thiolase family protein [Bacteroidota bacterium]
MQSAYIVSARRTAVGRALKGSLRNVRPEAMGAQVLKALLALHPEMPSERVDDVLMGCAMPEGSQGMNLGRLIALKAGLPDSVPGATVNRFCSSGLQTIAMGAQSIMSGFNDVILAGGVESMSQVPMTGFHYQPDPDLMREDPDVYVSMGNTAENVAQKYGITREDQDAFALSSHQKALKAINDGSFTQEIVPLTLKAAAGNTDSTPPFEVDEGPRTDTSIEALQRLPAVFRQKGTVTAGNSSQMSDGAAATLLVSESVLNELGMTPMARLVGFAVAGVAPELMGIGPVEAVPKVLRQTGLTLSDIGLIELNEAFASQSLAVIKELHLDPDIVNVHGGAIALGHPLGCTGAKLTTTLLHEMKRRNIQYGLCTMCIGGGMGAAGIFELLDRN